MNITDKGLVAVAGICTLGILQCAAWQTGHNGTVFALTSSGIGAIIGSYFDLKGFLAKFKE